MDGVKLFLNNIGMLQYYDMFITKGYDLESDLQHITSKELQDVLMIACQEDRAKLLEKAQSYKPSAEHLVYEWLRGCSLDYYFIGFVQSELTDLQRIAQLQLPNEDLYDELEIVLPGHRKRLERAVEKLRSEQMRAAGPESPVAYGWWGKPECLPHAKFDFLCVKALLFSSQDSQNRAAVDFMVDSGSDVSTVQESTLDSLNLDLIGPVYSCGVHGGNHCNLYRACLAVGDVEMEIEVMGSNYNSLGSRVVRHFRHVIDGHRHIWLTGNYQDTLPAILPLQMPQSSSVQSAKALPAPSNTKDIMKTNTTPSTHSSNHMFTVALENHKVLPENASVSNEFKSGVKEGGPTTVNSDCEINVVSYTNTSLCQVSGNGEVLNAVLKDPSINFSHMDSVSNNSQNESEKSTYALSSSKPPTVLDSAKDLTKNSNSPIIIDKLLRESCANGSTDLSGGMSMVAEKKDLTDNQRVSLSNVLPANLRDTDDDVDNHYTPSCDEMIPSSTIKESEDTKSSVSILKDPKHSEPHTTLSGLTDGLYICNKKQIEPHLLNSTFQTDNHSFEEAKSMLFANNFVHASNEVVLLTMDDLDDSDLASPHNVNTSSSNQDQLLCEGGRNDPQAFVEDLFHSPRKKFKFDNS